MDKMKMETVDITAQNIDKIGEMFPNCITETVDDNGRPKKAINFELLKQMLSSDVLEGDEAYEFTWVGKKAAIVEANRPIRKTLRPCKEESKNWDTTENLYIEGDNLEVLKLLQESYLGKVKMIYIDPPYNTGSDFIYNDDFKMTSEEYADELGATDEDGNRMFKNTDSNGRFHSDWCSMIYSRLSLARNLLTDDGVIFISIDDNEVENLKKICNEIFGESNYIASIVPLMNPRGSQSSKNIAINHEYILMIAKSENCSIYGLELTDEQKKEYNKKDAIGCFREIGLRKRGADSRREDSPNLYFPIYYNEKTNEISTTIKYDIEILPKLSNGIDGRWRWSSKKVEVDKNQLLVRLVNRNGTQEYDVFSKDYLTEDKKRKPMSVWGEKAINNEFATEMLHKIFGTTKIFDYSKSLFLIKRLITISTKSSDIILDFFSGSATTAHAVMLVNAEDGGNRKFIMVQLPELTDEKHEAYKAGYKNICEIGKERIRRAGVKILEDNKDKENIEKLDTGFRVLKLDETNMNDVYYSANEYDQRMISMLESNVKADRSDLDLLFSCLLEWGLPLSMPYCSEQIEGYTVHTYNDGDLIACFDENVPDSVVKTIAKRQPLRVVFRDSSFANSPSKINVTEIFKLLAPDTRVKVI